MSDVDDEIDESPLDLLCRATVLCLLDNQPLSEILEDRIYHHDPESYDPFRIPDSVLVFPKPERLILNPQPGNAAHPSYSVVVCYVASVTNAPRSLGDMTPDRIMWHMEKILERGTVNQVTGEAFTPGKLVDPRITLPPDPLMSPKDLFLSVSGPTFRRSSKLKVPSKEGTSSTMIWPMEVTWRSTTSRIERSPR